MSSLQMNDYDYPLPDRAVADRPLEERSQSRLMCVELGSKAVRHNYFTDIIEEIPAGSLLLINSSKVIPARIAVTKKTGGAAEVLLLQPFRPHAEALASTSRSQWSALIGGKRIAAGDTLQGPEGIQVQVLAKDGATAEIDLQWGSGQPLGELLEQVGRIPLPPYFHREDDASDRVRYQTVYADQSGSVAAPTAGLHFTPQILEDIARKATIATVHLHIGAGTFKPVDAQDARDHIMHAETIHVSLETLDLLTQVAAQRDAGGTGRIVVVGTTSLRTLESIAICGQRLLEGGPLLQDGLVATQWEGRTRPRATQAELFQAVAQAVRSKGLNALVGPTQLMIAPGFAELRADRLITNFHQPRSTLLLLVAAFSEPAGIDFWKHAYSEALERGYRFLSYGDSSIWIRR
jgi:S-adenosylmethionine:tRNA ribosyltransferase-isomerase